MHRQNSSKHDCVIRLERPSDYPETEQLVRKAFWNVYRPGCFEHFVLHCYREREDFIPALDFVMEKGGRLIGQVMYVRSQIQTDDGHIIPIMTFGPISIAPDAQGNGYGSILLRHSMEAAKQLGAGALAITGSSNFYGKFGFVPGKARGIRYAEDPEADYFLGKELIPGYLDGISGTFRDPDGYAVDETELEAFDRQFPPKKKKKLPGQLAD